VTENKNIYQRILAVTESVGAFAKDGKNTFHNYAYASIEAIVADIQPELIKNGIALLFEVDECVQMPVRQFTTAKGWNENEVTRVHIIMEAVNTDTPTDKVSKGVYGFGIDSQDKGIYKAISGARKYGIFGMFNLMSGDDDPEHDTGTPPVHQPAQAKPKPATGTTTAKPKSAPKVSQNTSDVNVLALRDALFPGLQSWPPQREYMEKMYDIDPAFAKWPESCSQAMRKKIMITLGERGYGSDEHRHELIKAFYKAFNVPQPWATTSAPGFTKGHGMWMMNLLEHANFASKAADDPLPWENLSIPTEGVELDADIDLTEDEDYLVEK